MIVDFRPILIHKGKALLQVCEEMSAFKPKIIPTNTKKTGMKNAGYFSKFPNKNLRKGKTMKDHLGFSSFCLLLAVLLLSSSLQAAFKIDVHINGATNPTLTFGEAEARTRSPHPPFSGMFGVVDVCFAGAKDDYYEAQPENIREYYDRLAEDIKEPNIDNQWIILAKNNVRLTFKLKGSELVPSDIKIVYYDPKKPGSEDKIETTLDFGQNGEKEPSFSVKTGGVYTITRKSNAEPEPDPNKDKNQFVPKDGAGEIEIVLKDKDNVPFTPKTVEISFVSALGIVAYADEDVTERIPPINERDVDWWVSVSLDGYDVAYCWSTPYTILKITLTPKDSTRGEDNDFSISMTPTRSAKSVTTIVQFLDEQNDLKLTRTTDWTPEKTGTLDFDGDGTININDVMYLYNFLNDGMPDFSENVTKETNSIRKLLKYTSKNPENSDDFETAKNTMNTLRSNKDSLILDGGERMNIDQVMYLYNFLNDGMPEFSDNVTKETNSAKKLLKYTSKNSENSDDFETAKTALETLRDYKDNL